MHEDHEKKEDDKSLADEMAEQDEQLAKAMEQQEDVAPPGEPEVEDLTIESIESFLIEEGQWLEAQVAADKGVYKNCPLCPNMVPVFGAFVGALQDALEALDKMREDGVDEELILEFLKRDRAWYLTSKNMAMMLFEQGHMPRNVINAHPELRSMAAQKRQQRRKQSRKSRKSRKKNR